MQYAEIQAKTEICVFFWRKCANLAGFLAKNHQFLLIYKYAWHFPWFLIPCEEWGKEWNSLSRNEENSRNFFTSNEHLIYPKKCTKNLQKFFLQKSAIFFVKGTQFSTPQTIFIAFLCINIFHTSNFAKKKLLFLPFFCIFPCKTFFLLFYKGAQNIFKAPHGFQSSTNVRQGAHV